MAPVLEPDASAQPTARPRPVIGIVGGGQLARMMAQSAIELGLHLRVLCEGPGMAAGQVVPDAPVGDYHDYEVLSAFARGVDVLTFDHEHVPHEHLVALEREGVTVRPSPAALVYAQDKLVMRRAAERLGLRNPRWAEVHDAAELEAFGARVGWPLVLKTPRGGYDGKGVMVAGSPADAEAWLATARAEGHLAADTGLPEGLLAEEKVSFVRELAALVARNPAGQTEAWPVAETVQTHGICHEVLAPAPDLDPAVAQEATRTALTLAEELGVTGVMAMELFEVTGPDGRPSFVINELAMRPHNSGHWTQDGAVTSQFEQHLRAVAGLPLGGTAPVAPWTVMGNILGGTREDLASGFPEVMADPGIKVHLYGKAVRPGRKVGHVNVVGEDLAELRARAARAAQSFENDSAREAASR